jgi:hypothetical protein
MRVKPHIDLFHPQPEGQDNKFILNLKARTKKKKKNTPQVAAEERDIVDIPSKDTHWPKKTIRSKVEKTKSGSRFTN